MKTSTKNVVQKRPGRPATGQDPVTAIRLSQALREAVDKWASSQDDKPSRSEAIRRLIEVALKSRPTPEKKSKKEKRRPDFMIQDRDGRIIETDSKTIGEFLIDYVGLQPDGSIDPAKAHRSVDDEEE